MLKVTVAVRHLCPALGTLPAAPLRGPGVVLRPSPQRFMTSLAELSSPLFSLLTPAASLQSGELTPTPHVD